MPWVVLTIQPGLDNGARTERGLNRIGCEFYNPKISTVWTVRNKPQNRIVQLFPGYMFVNIVAQWVVLKSVSGVYGLIRDESGPLYLSDETITALQHKEVDGVIQLTPLAKPGPEFKNGDIVVLNANAGVYIGHNAVYARASGSERSTVLLRMLKRSVSIELPNSALEVA